MVIELRWLAYESLSNPETGEHFQLPSTYKRLQYRTMMRTVMSRDDPPCGMIHWSEWQDVPEAVAAPSNRRSP